MKTTKIGLLIRLLAESPKTQHQLEMALQVSTPTIRNALKGMRADGSRVVFVSAWTRSSAGRQRPLFSLGNQADAPKPPKRSAAERSKEWREKNRQPVPTGDAAVEATVTAFVADLPATDEQQAA